MKIETVKGLLYLMFFFFAAVGFWRVINAVGYLENDLISISEAIKQGTYGIALIIISTIGCRATGAGDYDNNLYQ